MPADQLTTSRAELDNDPVWDQINVEFADWATAGDVVARDLRPVLNQMAGGWWYIRKHPHWRLRHRAGTDPDRQPAAQLRAALDDLSRNGVLRAWHPAIYEPEILAFGGPAGMHVAHDLFCRDSRTTLDLLASTATPAAAAGRTELSLLAISRMLRAAGLDWYEQGDVWANVADSRRGPDTITRAVAADAPAAVRRLVTLDTGPDTALVTNGPLRAHRAWLDTFDTAGSQVGALARTGHLTRGLRAVLAHHIIFHWNRLALPSHDQHTLAALARDALLPTDVPFGLQNRPGATVKTPTTPTTQVPELLEQVARRFPLVPRHRPALPPLGQQLADIADLARTPPDHPDAAVRIAAAHNKAALVASNCGHQGLARALCWQHHHRYTDHQPWTAIEARRALEPLVNLARLHIRAGHPDTAIEALGSLLSAIGQGGMAEIDGYTIDLGDSIAIPDDRAEVRRWVWAVTLAEGVRALARAGRWDDALAHAHRHRGIGATLLDGRQIAVIAHSLRGDHTDAATLLTDTVHAEPWQHSVAHVLGLLICRRAGTATPHNAHQLTDPQHATGQAPATGGFGLEVQLAAVELVGDAARSDVLAELTRTTAVITDAALARTVLTHPARRHLPASQLDRLNAIHNLATTTTTAESLDNALTNALTGHLPDHHDNPMRSRGACHKCPAIAEVAHVSPLVSCRVS